MKVVHCKIEKYDVLIDRSTKFGNPFSHKADTKALVVVPTAQEAVACFKNLLIDGGEFLEAFGIEYKSELYSELINRREIILDSLHELEGKTLGCWCKNKPENFCHGDVYVELIEKKYE